VISISERKTRVVSPSRINSKSLRIAIVYLPIAQLKLNPTNPRLHSEKQIRQIAQSIRLFGFLVPVVVDGQGLVLAGHGRLLAATLLDMVEVPTVSIEYLTEHEVRAFALADNKLTENSQWDRKLLAEQLKMLCEAELDFSVDVTGFEMDAVDVLVEGLTAAPKGNCDPADALPETTTAAPVSEPGDVWLLGRHRVLCGNSLDESSFSTLMQDRRANVVITDPPCNLAGTHVTEPGSIRPKESKMVADEMNESEFADCLAQAFRLLASHSVNGSLHYIFTDWPHAGEILTAGKHAYSKLRNVCVWIKDKAGTSSLYRNQHELVFVFQSGQHEHWDNVRPIQFGRHRTNVWSYPGLNSFSRTAEEKNLVELHPTVKPVSLVVDVILDCSAQGNIVLDPFLGSGTTLMAAERTGRICHGIELGPGNVDTILRRWQALNGLVATHVVSGRSFADLEQEAENEQR
jgi:DNA modification methylase